MGGVCYVVSLVIDIILIFLSTISVVEFDEIRTSKKNPIEQCEFLNPLVLPEYSLHAGICLIFLHVSDWISCVLNIALLAYHIHRYWSRPVMSCPGLYDPTSILDIKNIRRCQIEGWSKLAFYIFLFF